MRNSNETKIGSAEGEEVAKQKKQKTKQTTMGHLCVYKMPDTIGIMATSDDNDEKTATAMTTRRQGAKMPRVTIHQPARRKKKKIIHTNENKAKTQEFCENASQRERARARASTHEMHITENGMICEEKTKEEKEK